MFRYQPESGPAANVDALVAGSQRQQGIAGVQPQGIEEFCPAEGALYHFCRRGRARLQLHVVRAQQHVDTAAFGQPGRSGIQLAEVAGFQGDAARLVPDAGQECSLADKIRYKAGRRLVIERI